MDQIFDLQASVYWCKKRMTPESLAAYLAQKGTSAQANAKRAEEIVSANVPKDQADAYMYRADNFAKAHPTDFLAIAIRYFEVADRFVGMPASLAAQRLSLDAQRKAVTSADGRENGIGKGPKSQIKIKEDLPEVAKKAIEASNAAIAMIAPKGSANLNQEKQRAIDVLLRIADSEQKKGDLEPLLAIQAQVKNMDVAQNDLCTAAQTVMDAFVKAKRRLVEKVSSDIVAEKQKLLVSLGKIQADEVRKGNTSGAISIKDAIVTIRTAITARETSDDAAEDVETNTHVVGTGSAPFSASGGDNGTPVMLNNCGIAGTIGAPFNYTVAGSSDPTGYSATGLPEGLSLKACIGSELKGNNWVHFNMGQITGTPSGSPGTYTAKISATNAKGTTTVPLTFFIRSTTSKGKFFTTYKDANGVWWLKDPNGKLIISKAMDGLAGGPITMSGQGPSDMSLVLADNFNTVGAWSGYDCAPIPGTSNSNMGYTGVMLLGKSYDYPQNNPVSARIQFPDLWAAHWITYCQSLAYDTCAQYSTDPWIQGWYSDNELFWGYEWDPAGGNNLGATAQTELLLRFMGASSDYGGHDQAVAFVHKKYGTDEAGLAALNAAWSTKFTDWAQIGKEPSPLTTMQNRTGVACYNDCNEFAGIVADRYFSTTTAAIKAADPNHLILGCRFTSRSHPLPAVLVAEAKYVDAISFNCYATDPSSDIQFYSTNSGNTKPVIIGEFAFSSIQSNTSGDTNPLNAIDEPTQAARASAYATYVQTGMSNKNLIGYSWFLVQDNPPDNGSDYGITDIHNNPYMELNLQIRISNEQAETIHAAAAQ